MTKRHLIFLVLVETLILIWILIHLYKPTCEITRLESRGTRVFHYSGTTMQELQNFCTWTQSFRCAKLNTTRGKIPLYVHDSEKDPVSKYVSEEGSFEHETLEVVLSETQRAPGITFLDIGSNIGVFAMTVASNLQVPTVAVDPVFANMVLLCRSVEVNDLTNKVTLFVNAMSDSHDEINLNIVTDNFPYSKVVPATERKVGSGCKDRPSFSMMLDDIIPFMTTKSAVLKIDVESHEYHVINGGKRFLQEIDVSAIIMEWKHVQRTPNAGKLLNIMKTSGFYPYTMKYFPLSYDEEIPALKDVLWLKRKL